MNEGESAVNGGLEALARLEDALAQMKSAKYPPVEKWRPKVVREIGLRVDRAGIWYYQDSPIKRPELVKLFASVLRREEDGRYALVTPAEKIWLQVEDAPLLAVDMTTAGEGSARKIIIRSNVGDITVIDAQHPVWMQNNRPYIRLRGRIDALITRALYYDLVDIAEQRDASGPYGVWSNGHFFELGHED